MQNVIDVSANSSQIPLTALGGRTVGRRAAVTGAEFELPVPEALSVLGNTIQRESRLLALTGHVDKDGVFAAYGADTQLLKRYRDEFDAAMRAAIGANLSSGSPQSFADAWNALLAQIPDGGALALLRLDANLAAKDADEIRNVLGRQFRVAVQQLLRRFTTYLQLLVDREFFGLVEWTKDPEVARLHYFRHEHTTESTGSQTRIENRGDGFSRRTTIQTLLSTTHLERHVHDLVGVRQYDLKDYPGSFPERVKRFLLAVPEWLRPLLQVVTGQVVLAQTITVRSDTQETVRTEVSEWTYDPAITLGNVALIGWLPDEESAPVAERVPTQQGPHPLATFIREHSGKLVLLAILLVIAAGVKIIVRAVSSTRLADYATYIEAVGDSHGDPLTAHRGDLIALGNLAKEPLVVDRVFEEDTVTRLRLRMPQKGLTTDFALAYRGDGVYYGTLQLGPAFGVYARMHVLSCEHSSDTGQCSIRYVIVPYPESQLQQK